MLEESTASVPRGRSDSAHGLTGQTPPHARRSPPLGLPPLNITSIFVMGVGMGIRGGIGMGSGTEIGMGAGKGARSGGRDRDARPTASSVASNSPPDLGEEFVCQIEL